MPLKPACYEITDVSVLGIAPHPTHLEPLDQVGEANDVVEVGVGDDQKIDAGNPMLVKQLTRQDLAVPTTGVDDHPLPIGERSDDALTEVRPEEPQHQLPWDGTRKTREQDRPA